jgi:decaprenylphospho-beta-D-erythro-pentofuranosid-2-ulose 2-reductase
MTANRVLIIGSTAALGQALAEEYAKTGCPLMLAARDLAAQREVAADLRLRYAIEIHEFFYDANDATCYHPLIDSIVAVGLPRRLFFVAGAIGESDDLYSAQAVESLTRVNYLGVASLMADFLPLLKGAAGSRVTFIGSVAGDRGRAVNPLYCAAKSALDTYAEGIRQLLQPQGVGVCLVRLGYVDSRLSYGRTPRALTLPPAKAAALVKRACEDNRSIVYIPWWWSIVMTGIKMIPEVIWKRLPPF